MLRAFVSSVILGAKPGFYNGSLRGGVTPQVPTNCTNTSVIPQNITPTQSTCWDAQNGTQPNQLIHRLFPRDSAIETDKRLSYYSGSVLPIEVGKKVFAPHVYELEQLNLVQIDGNQMRVPMNPDPPPIKYLLPSGTKSIIPEHFSEQLRSWLDAYNQPDKLTYKIPFSSEFKDIEPAINTFLIKHQGTRITCEMIQTAFGWADMKSGRFLEFLTRMDYVITKNGEENFVDPNPRNDVYYIPSSIFNHPNLEHRHSHILSTPSFLWYCVNRKNGKGTTTDLADKLVGIDIDTPEFKKILGELEQLGYIDWKEGATSFTVLDTKGNDLRPFPTIKDIARNIQTYLQLDGDTVQKDTAIAIAQELKTSEYILNGGNMEKEAKTQLSACITDARTVSRVELGMWEKDVAVALNKLEDAGCIQRGANGEIEGIIGNEGVVIENRRIYDALVADRIISKDGNINPKSFQAAIDGRGHLGHLYQLMNTAGINMQDVYNGINDNCCLDYRYQIPRNSVFREDQETINKVLLENSESNEVFDEQMYNQMGIDGPGKSFEALKGLLRELRYIRFLDSKVKGSFTPYTQYYFPPDTEVRKVYIDDYLGELQAEGQEITKETFRNGLSQQIGGTVAVDVDTVIEELEALGYIEETKDGSIQINKPQEASPCPVVEEDGDEIEKEPEVKIKPEDKHETNIPWETIGVFGGGGVGVIGLIVLIKLGISILDRQRNQAAAQAQTPIPLSDLEQQLEEAPTTRESIDALHTGTLEQKKQAVSRLCNGLDAIKKTEIRSIDGAIIKIIGARDERIDGAQRLMDQFTEDIEPAKTEFIERMEREIEGLCDLENSYRINKGLRHPLFNHVRSFLSNGSKRIPPSTEIDKNDPDRQIKKAAQLLGFSTIPTSLMKEVRKPHGWFF